MLLSREDAELFFELHCALMQFVMEQIQGADVAAPAAAYRALAVEQRQPVAMQRAAFNQGLIPYVPADRAAAAVQ